MSTASTSLDATDTTIEWNLIYANADRGIQLYPNAEYTTIDHNIIDDNGEGILFAGDDGTASSYNRHLRQHRERRHGPSRH